MASKAPPREGYFTGQERGGIDKFVGKLSGKFFGKKYVQELERFELVPHCGRIGTLEEEARQLREMMAAFQARESEL